MMKIDNKIIIWGIDDFNTLGLLRQLGRFDLDLLFLIKGTAKFAVKSKYCKEYYLTSSLEDGRRYLLSNYSKSNCKPILIVSGDDIITYIDKNRNELIKYFILPGTLEQGKVGKFIDKNTMTSFAESCGILCPKSKYVNKKSSVDDITYYPCIIKPSHERLGHYNEFKFKICNNKRSLNRVLKFVNPESHFIVQQYIKKRLDVLIYGGRMFDGKTILAGAFIRDRWADSGSSSHGVITSDIPSCIDTNAIVTFLNRIEYFGLFSFEYGMVDGKAYFFEVNLRNDGTSHYFFQAGANIPLAYVMSCVGADYSSINTKVRGINIFIDEFFDIENVIKGRLGLRKYRNDKKSATIFKYYDENDLRPWRFVKKYRWIQITQDFILKKFRIYIILLFDKLGLRK